MLKKAKKPINAVIYARYSSHAQREESIEGQIRECLYYAEKNNMVVVGEYIDRAISGRTDERLDFQRLIRDSEKRQFQAVIMYTLDRFSRSRYDSAIYKAILKKNGVSVHYAKQYIPDTPEGIILESILEGYAEYYSENLSRNVKRGMRENALQCKATGGGRCLGYRTGADMKYEIEPFGAKIVKEIFDLYADGKTIAEIIRYCNSQGYKTMRGNDFSNNSLTIMLKNIKYIGIYKYGDIEIEGGIPAIIDKDTFFKVQDLLNRKARRRMNGNNFLLTTKLYCGHCGSYMVGDSGTSATGKTYTYYICNNKECDKKRDRKEELERFVVDVTADTVLDDETIEKIADNAVALLEKEASDTSVLPSLQNTLKSVDKRIKGILDLAEKGTSSDDLAERLEILSAEKKDIQRQISREKIKKPPLTKEQIIYWLSQFKDGNRDNPKFKEDLINSLVHSVTISDIGKKEREVTFTFNLSGNNTGTVKSSDSFTMVDPKRIELSTSALRTRRSPS
jgi:site-specific DNA recombinase